MPLRTAVEDCVASLYDMCAEIFIKVSLMIFFNSDPKKASFGTGFAI